ncbi:MAG: precorrin-3B C(17)-methyltransferase [Pseudomonadota bacterium]
MGTRPAIVCLTGSALDAARRLADALDGDVFGKAGRVETMSDTVQAFDHAPTLIAELFLAGRPIIGMCAAGILIRSVAPFLSGKRIEPPVLAIAEGENRVVPLLGGHRGANRLAKAAAAALSGEPVITTAGDAVFGIALDEPGPGWTLANPTNARSVMAALLDGAGASIDGELPFTGLGELPSGGGVRLVGTETPVAGDDRTLVYHPHRYCLGVGSSRDCPPAELIALAEDVLNEAGIARGGLAGVFSVDLKMDEPAVEAVADHFAVPIRYFTADRLECEAERLANPSDIVFAEIGCHGVAEGAALAGGGSASSLVVQKQKSAMGTAALARAPEPLTTLPGHRRGRLSVVGIGPGDRALRTPEASRAIHGAEELVGYSLYLDLLGPATVGKTVKAFPLGDEEARCRYALERAGEGIDVALICSGDPGIYAMASPVFELLERPEAAGGVSAPARRADVVVVTGVSAMQRAAALLGAPIGHDFCAISLSDLLTPRDAILARVEAAGLGDFVVAFYNPVSKTRRDLLERARRILITHRPASTPVALASNLGRDDERVRYRTLESLVIDEVDMLTTVLVGSSDSRLVTAGGRTRLYTPRGYRKKHERGAA